MRIPAGPPDFDSLIRLFVRSENSPRLKAILDARIAPVQDGRYRHWDTVRRLTPPQGLSHDEWWFGIKLARGPMLKPLPLLDGQGGPIRVAMPDPAQEMANLVDRSASGLTEISEQMTNPEIRDRYLVRFLMEEAITSSQLEGASTTTAVAKEMLRTGRKPRDVGERMILNNYEAIRMMRALRKEPLTPSRVLDLHRILTRETPVNLDAAGRLRTRHEHIIVTDERENVLHTPPKAEELESRLAALCEFANGAPTTPFLHPVVRAIVVHFGLAYDHPFVDGNGRTARALFYWCMLAQGYWLSEYVSLSRLIKAAPAKYARAFRYCETDGNDVTYFVLNQLGVILSAFEELHEYLTAKAAELRETERLLRRAEGLNHRQLALLGHALRHADARYSIASHRRSHDVVYETARTDLLDLEKRGYMRKTKIGRALCFIPSPALAPRGRARPR